VNGGNGDGIFYFLFSISYLMFDKLSGYVVSHENFPLILLLVPFWTFTMTLNGQDFSDQKTVWVQKITTHQNYQHNIVQLLSFQRTIRWKLTSSLFTIPSNTLYL
jgi:hypothetical protein